jgi:hypothetical protein
MTGRIIDLKDHPQSTAGDVAKALSANRNTTATRLSQMAKKGQITQASKGYAVKYPTRTHRSDTPFRNSHHGGCRVMVGSVRGPARLVVAESRFEP